MGSSSFSTAIAPARLLQLLWRHRAIFVATTRNELTKRYSGTLLGRLWLVLYPILFLCIYLFVYLVVFRVRFPGFSNLDYVIYVFSGLVPYIALMESLSAAVLSIRQNLHMVRNVILPVELVPLQCVAAALATQLIGLAMVALLSAINGSLGLTVLWLLAAVVLQAVFLAGLALFFAALGLGLPDAAPMVNLGLLFMLFISPIAYQADMVPSAFSFIVTLNPVTYMIETFRAALLYGAPSSLKFLGVFTMVAVVVFWLAAVAFSRFRNHLMDYA